MQMLNSKFSLFVLVILLVGCVYNPVDYESSPSNRVATIDQVQARSCIYLYSTSLVGTGYNSATATADAIYDLKSQVLVANGNAIRVTDVYPTTRYQNGYSSEAANVNVDVYKCPFETEE